MVDDDGNAPPLSAYQTDALLLDESPLAQVLGFEPSLSVLEADTLLSVTYLFCCRDVESYLVFKEPMDIRIIRTGELLRSSADKIAIRLVTKFFHSSCTVAYVIIIVNP